MTIAEVFSAPDSPMPKAQILLAHILKKDKSFLHAHPEYELSVEEQELWQQAKEQLASSVPIAYILGEKEFYGYMFEVSPSVLIPRPETEMLVEEALLFVVNRLESNLVPVRILEVGTGSGAIIISLVKTLKTQGVLHDPTVLEVLATDISSEALEVAQRNAQKHGVGKYIMFEERDLLSGIQAPFDLVIANLPYLPHQEAVMNLYEPQLALDGGVEGTELVEVLKKQTPSHINEGGLLLLEVYGGSLEKHYPSNP